MLFNSLEFLLFFPIAVTIYFALAFKYRWIWLLGCSYFFYMCWNPTYAIIIMFSTVVTYLSGRYLEKFNNLESSEKRAKLKKRCVAISFSVNILILMFFKYFNFLSENITLLSHKFGLGWESPSLNILLPVGISFYIFQSLSYTMDVYRGDIKAEKHFGKYALFVSFFPQLVAGPIERSTNLLPQFSEKKSFDYHRVRDGLFIMLLGFFKKIVIADRLGAFVDIIYNNPTEYQGLSLLIATIFFSIQIYCDFSAYSDIAIGAAKVMGYDLMKNFNKPYFSKSIAEFWRNWHISLSTWFKDYLYIPLGGNRVSKVKVYRNIFIVFVVSGLWHGASWNFVIWGALHGIFLITALLFSPIKEKIHESIKINPKTFFFRLYQIFTTYILVCFAWIFFRANTLPDALYIIKNLFSTSVFELEKVGLEKLDFNLSIGLIIFLIVSQIIDQKINIKEFIYKQNIVVRWSLWILLIVIIIFWGYYPKVAAQFIYFQF